MNDDRPAQLKQLANIVIDAYLNRDQQFVPVFDAGTQAVMYPSRPEGNKDHPDLRLNVWYERSHYESSVTPREKNDDTSTTE